MILVTKLPKTLLSILFYMRYNIQLQRLVKATYTNQSCWHWRPHLCSLCMGLSRSTQSKPICLTWWPHNHLTKQQLIMYTVLVIMLTVQEPQGSRYQNSVREIWSTQEKVQQISRRHTGKGRIFKPMCVNKKRIEQEGSVRGF